MNIGNSPNPLLEIDVLEWNINRTIAKIPNRTLWGTMENIARKMTGVHRDQCEHIGVLYSITNDIDGATKRNLNCGKSETVRVLLEGRRQTPCFLQFAVHIIKYRVHLCT